MGRNKAGLESLLDEIVSVEEEFDLTSIWPCQPIQAEVYFSPNLSWRVFKKFTQDPVSFKKALDKVPVDILRFFLLTVGIIGLKVARKYKLFGGEKITTASITQFVEEVLNSIKRRVESDPLCRDGNNWLIKRTNVSRLINNLPLIEVSTDEQKRLITGFGITLESASWALYFDSYRDGGFLLHGLYPTKSGQLLIRDGHNLQPPVWQPNTFPFKKIAIFGIYDNTIEVKIDFVNHLRFEKPIWQRLKMAAILVNDQPTSLDKIEPAEQQIEDWRARQVKFVEEMSPFEIIKKSYEIFSYCLKPFFNYYNEDWRPSTIEYDAMESLGLKLWERFSAVQHLPRLRDIYDPRRIDFYG